MALSMFGMDCFDYYQKERTAVKNKGETTLFEKTRVFGG
jgi:hypothetical protein